MTTPPNESFSNKLRRIYRGLVGSPFVLIVGGFMILSQISHSLGLYHENPDYHPPEDGWTYSRCLTELRREILDRNPDMVEVPDDTDFELRQRCSAHEAQHVR